LYPLQEYEDRTSCTPYESVKLSQALNIKFLQDAAAQKWTNAQPETHRAALRAPELFESENKNYYRERVNYLVI
jgi:hypothetical protein